MKSQELRQLREIIDDALDKLENITSRESPNGSWPPLDTPIDPILNQFEPHKNPEVQKLSNVVIAAAYQLISVVREPFMSLVDIACGVRLLIFFIDA